MKFTPFEKKEEGEQVKTALFYFMSEFNIYPLDEEYELEYGISKEKLLGFIPYDRYYIKKIIKKGIPMYQYNSLLSKMAEQHKKENENIKKVGRKR